MGGFQERLSNKQARVSCGHPLEIPTTTIKNPNKFTRHRDDTVAPLVMLAGGEGCLAVNQRYRPEFGWS